MRRTAVAGALLAIVLPVCGVALWIAAPPPGDTFSAGIPGTVIEDRHGMVLRETRGAEGERYARVSLDEIDPDLIAAVIAAEDRRFFRHRGVDAKAISRAAIANLRAGRVVSGGSTITMQLARMLRGTPRTATGKVSQALWALRLERHFTKQAILEHYLDRVPLGQGAIGIEAGARLYFDVSARELSLAEAATLAGVIRSPSARNPLVAPARAAARRDAVLARLVESGYASADAADRARQEPLIRSFRRTPFLAPHFTTHLLGAAAEDVPRGRWRTSLDAALQGDLEAEVRHTIETLEARGARHAAMVVLDNRTGDVLAWIGSPDFWADTAGQVDMVASARQPGSALKPFLYGLAFDRGYTPASVLADVARIYQTTGGPYSPRNYDRRFHGPVRAREALASSYNVPAVELASRLGVGSVLATLHRAGFASLRRDAEHYGLGLALGNGDVTLIELANAYRALANRGVWRPYRLTGHDATPGQGIRVMSDRAATLVLDILADPVARAPGFGFDTPLDFGFPAAAKTGTSRHFTDNWAVAVTGSFTVAVWVGNFSGRPLDGVSGVSGAGPLLHRGAAIVARRYAPGTLRSPSSAGLIGARICRLSGLRAGRECPVTDEWFEPGTVPPDTCDWHQAEGVRLPAAFAEWAAATRRGTVAQPMMQRTSLASEPDDSRFRIVSPRDGDRYRASPGVPSRYTTIALRSTGGEQAEVQWFVDGERVEGRRWALARGRHVVRAEADGTRDEVTIDVD